MDEIHRGGLLGFTAFERSALEASFRLAATRRPAYQLVDGVERARVLVVAATTPSRASTARRERIDACTSDAKGASANSGT